MTAPAPLVLSEVDLRDFVYMPLDVVRLRDSDLSASASAEEFRCAVLLWCASWHQIPAASLPDDDTILASLAGFGRSIREWLKVRDGALRHWIKCSDGRLYHPTVAEKANDAWIAKQRQRKRTAAARAARQSQSAHSDTTENVADSVTEPVTHSVTENVTSSKGRDRDRDRDSSETKVSAHSNISEEQQRADFYRRGKQILGDGSGGLLTKLLKAKGNIVPRARAALEEASTAGDCREYLGAIIRSKEHKTEQELRDAGEIW